MGTVRIDLRVIWVACAALQMGCSLKTMALRSVADTLAAPGSVYARDDDPELVRDAVPVVLKTMEQLHEALPSHAPLALALSRTCTSYGVAFIGEEADRVEERSVEDARVLRARQKRMLLRGRAYGLAALDLAIPGSRAALVKGERGEVSRLLAGASPKDVPVLYWTAAAWGAAIASAKDDLHLVGELPLVAALMQRALELDETFDEGALHEFFMIYDLGRSETEGGGPKSAKAHYQRARALSQNKKLGPLVSYAESIAVEEQDRAMFTRLLNEALAYDVDKDLDHRLVNILQQRRARWLLKRTDDLFAE